MKCIEQWDCKEKKIGLEAIAFIKPSLLLTYFFVCCYKRVDWCCLIIETVYLWCCLPLQCLGSIPHHFDHHIVSWLTAQGKFSCVSFALP